MNEKIPRNLLELLEQIQLEKFWAPLNDNLQITKISHFDYAQIKDLESIGMSKPAIRRLFDKIEKCKKTNNSNQIKITRKPPSPPTSSHSSNSTRFDANSLPRFNQDASNRSKLYNSNIAKSVIKKSVIENKSKCDSNINSSNSFHQSVIIRPSDIQISKDSKGEDEVLGVGHFGIVKKALWITQGNSKKLVAVKFLHNQDQDIKELINEISCMCGLNHENLIKLYGIVLDFKQSNSAISSGIIMVTELAAKGSLYNYLKKFRKHNRLLPITKLNSYILQISCGMEYLEQNKLIHRDLACRNILLSSSDQIKICDFGMTRNVNRTNGSYTMTETHKIPCAWYPPESIKSKVFSVKSDVWMFAVTSWEILSLCEHPWSNMNAGEILNAIVNEGKQLDVPNMCSRNFYSLLQKCWSISAIERPSFHAIKSLIKQTTLTEMKAKEDFNQTNKLEIVKDDQIVIIDGVAGRYWWKGQNQRTLQVGLFPRSLLDPQRKLTAEDISLPIKNSFIHTGHMSAQGNQKNWGNPASIDSIFLSNPMDPPDLIEGSNTSLTPEDTKPVQIVNSILPNQNNNNNNNNLINLIDVSNSTETAYQDYSVSIDSFSSAKSPSPFSINTSSHYYNNQNNDFEDHGSIIPIRIAPESNEPFYMNEKYMESKSSSQITETTRSLSSTSSITNDNRPPRPPKPTFTSKTETSKQTVSLPVHYNQSSNDSYSTFGSISPVKFIGSDNFFRPNSFNFNQTNLTANSQIREKTKINVDDFLNKVMKDVLNDFDNVKLNLSSNRKLI